MTRNEAIAYYQGGKIPKIRDLDGRWKVTMWRWWKFMRKDVKVITDGKGYNLYYIFHFIPVKWGKFTLVQQSDCVELIYKNGAVIDRVREHHYHPSIKIGMFNAEVSDVTVKVTNEPFTLTRIKE